MSLAVPVTITVPIASLPVWLSDAAGAALVAAPGTATLPVTVTQLMPAGALLRSVVSIAFQDRSPTISFCSWVLIVATRPAR